MPIVKKMCFVPGTDQHAIRMVCVYCLDATNTDCQSNDHDTSYSRRRVTILYPMYMYRSHPNIPLHHGLTKIEEKPKKQGEERKSSRAVACQ